jgi:hypothetical protein
MASRIQGADRLEKARQWQERLERAESRSGSLESFCREEGVSLPVFNYWRRRIGHLPRRGLVNKTQAKVPAFVPVEVTHEGATAERFARADDRALPDPRWVAEIILHLSGVRR